MPETPAEIINYTAYIFRDQEFLYENRREWISGISFLLPMFCRVMNSVVARGHAAMVNSRWMEDILADRWGSMETNQAWECWLDPADRSRRCTNRYELIGRESRHRKNSDNGGRRRRLFFTLERTGQLICFPLLEPGARSTVRRLQRLSVVFPTDS